MARARGRHHGDLRAALERAALELVMERGPRGFTLAEASRRAGASVAAPYNHFADRDALLRVLTLRGFQEQRERFQRAVAASVDPVRRIAAFATEYVDFAADRTGLFLLTSSSDALKEADPELQAAGAAIFALLEEPARALRGSMDEVRDLVYSVGATAHGFATLLCSGGLGGLVDPREFARTGAGRTAVILATS